MDSGNFFGVSKIIAIIGQPSDIDRTKPNDPEVMLIGGCLRDNPDGANLSKAASPMTYVTPNDAPVLTVHGTEDRTVPYDQAVRMDVELPKAGVPSLFRHVPTSQHGNFQHRYGRQSKGDLTA